MLVDGAIEEGYEGAEIGEGDVDEGRQLGMSAVAAGAKELQRENSKRLLSVAEFYKTKDLDTRMRVSFIHILILILILIKLIVCFVVTV
jgi:hypothetical protein